MRRIGVVGLVLLGLLAAGCQQVEGSGTVVSRAIDVGPFTALEVSHSFHVTVTTGDAESLTVHADDNLIDRLDVGVSGDTLHIGLRSGIDATNATLDADLTATSLSSIGAYGASIVTFCDTFATSSLDVTVSGASHLEGPLQVDDGSWELSGASVFALSGTAGSLEVTESGASHLGDPGFTVDDLSIDLSGAAQAELTVSGTLSASASGGATLRYAGSPTVERSDASGGASIDPIT